VLPAPNWNLDGDEGHSLFFPVNLCRVMSSTNLRGKLRPALFAGPLKYTVLMNAFFVPFTGKLC
jgi:hypothetical protein